MFIAHNLQLKLQDPYGIMKKMRGKKLQIWREKSASDPVSR